MGWLDNLTRKLRTPICPYCFNPVKKDEAPYRCLNEPRRCAPEADSVYAQAWEDSSLKGKVLSASSGGHCRCGMTSNRRLCPHCHMDLVPHFGEDDNIMLAIIGAKDSGKSHYLAVLIDRLKREVAPRLNASFMFVREASHRRYKQDFYGPLFEQGRQLLGTTSAAGNFDVRIPMVYRMSFRNRDSGIGKVVTLVFFDTAGEDLDDQDLMAVLNKYIYQSDGIILLMDPLQVPAIRRQLASSRHLPETYSDPMDIVTRAKDLIASAKNLSSKDKIDIPLAVTFSKIDAIKDLLGANSQLNGRAQPGAGFDLADFQAVSSELESLLVRQDEKALHSAVCTHFRRYGFFGISALGSSPDEAGNIKSVQPHRVEDPVLWLLFAHGLIPEIKLP